MGRLPLGGPARTGITAAIRSTSTPLASLDLEHHGDIPRMQAERRGVGGSWLPIGIDGDFHLTMGEDQNGNLTMNAAARTPGERRPAASTKLASLAVTHCGRGGPDARVARRYASRVLGMGRPWTNRSSGGRRRLAPSRHHAGGPPAGCIAWADRHRDRVGVRRAGVGRVDVHCPYDRPAIE